MVTRWTPQQPTHPQVLLSFRILPLLQFGLEGPLLPMCLGSLTLRGMAGEVASLALLPGWGPHQRVAPVPLPSPTLMDVIP